MRSPVKYLRTTKRTEHLSGVHHRIMIRLGPISVKIALRHWRTPSGHRECFVKVQAWHLVRVGER